MKKVYMGALAAGLLFLGCGEKHDDEKVQKPTVMPQSAQESTAAEETPSNAEIYGVKARESTEQMPQNTQQQPGVKEGTVTETMDAGVYTYAKIDDGNGQYWIAGPKTPLKVGEKVSFLPQMWMENFPSKTLNRTFDKVLFVAVIAPLKGDSTHNCEKCGTKQKPVEKEGNGNAGSSSAIPVAKAEGGYTIAEIFAQSADLKDKSVKVNGRVTKIIRGVMGKDWVHIQDGTGTEGKNDLVATSASADVKEGDVVTVTGKLKTDVDFGYGYFYPVIIEDASFKKADS